MGGFFKEEFSHVSIGYNGVNCIGALEMGYFGLDGLSYVFLFLAVILVPVCIIISWDSIRFLIWEFLVSLFVLIFFLICVFTIRDILGFYIFFEATLMPMFLIVVL